MPGIARVDDRTEVAALKTSDDALARAVAAGFFPARSGDLIVVPKPNWIFVSDDKAIVPGNATTHGTGYAYDTQVPLILLGAGIVPGNHEAAASPADIAPTLAEAGWRRAADGYRAAPRRSAQEIRWPTAFTRFSTVGSSTTSGRRRRFHDARVATIQAAMELYGGTSAETRAVTDAWTAVGVF